MKETGLPEKTYRLTFFDREGEVDSILEFTDETLAKTSLDCFREPDSEDLYSRIVFTVYDWTEKAEAELARLTF